MFGSMPTSWNTVSSWLGVGQRPKDNEEGGDNKENENKGQSHSESKDSIISSTSVETSGSVSSKEVTETESIDGESKASNASESSPDASPLDALEDAATKGLNTAKELGAELGNFLFTFGKSATKTVIETGTKIKHQVEEKTILGDFHKEQNKFVGDNKEKHAKEEAAVAPWVGYNDEENLKTQIMALSLDKRNFVRNPPSGVQFQFDFASSYPVAMATLQEDMNLQKRRFDLVPKIVKEEVFWRNYFYRVSLIRQSSQLAASLDQQSGKNSSSSSRRSSTGTSASGGEQKESAAAVEEAGVVETQSQPDNDDFVSDSFGEQINEEDVRREMEEQLQVNKGEDWEKELAQELQDYELVDGDTAEDDCDDALEKEILEQIEQEANSLS